MLKSFQTVKRLFQVVFAWSRSLNQGLESIPSVDSTLLSSLTHKQSRRFISDRQNTKKTGLPRIPILPLTTASPYQPKDTQNTPNYPAGLDEVLFAGELRSNEAISSKISLLPVGDESAGAGGPSQTRVLAGLR